MLDYKYKINDTVPRTFSILGFAYTVPVKNNSCRYTKYVYTDILLK